MSDTDLSKRSLLTNSLLVGGGLIAATSMPATAQTSPTTITTVATFAALASTPAAVGQIVETKCHTSGIIGGNSFIGVSQGTLTANTGSISASSTAGIYWQIRKTILSIEDFGGAASFSAATNLIALKAVIAATATNGIFVIPEGKTFIIDATGGLSTTAEIPRPMTMQLDGSIKSNYSARPNPNPPYILKVTGDNVFIVGNGSIIGDGAIDDINDGTVFTFSGLVYVTGKKFCMRDVTIVDPPKSGITMLNSHDSTLLNVTCAGGVVTYTKGNPGHFGVVMSGCVRVLIDGMRFIDGSNSGRVVNGIFCGGALGGVVNCTIVNCSAWYPHEKLAYVHGEGNKINNNTVVGALHGCAIRLWGNYNCAKHNVISDGASGITALDGKYNVIEGNEITCQEAGISVGYEDGDGDLTGTKVRNNVCIRTGAKSNDEGILINMKGYSFSTEIEVSGNTCVNFGGTETTACIRLIHSSSSIGNYYCVNPQIINNTIRNGGNIGITIQGASGAVVRGTNVDKCVLAGIYGNRCDDIEIYDSKMTNPGIYPVLFGSDAGAVSNPIIENNKSIGSTSFQSGNMPVGSQCSGNQYTRTPLVGSVTLSAAVTTTVPHGGVANNAKIFLQASNNVAGLAVATKGWPTTAISGNNFTITMADGIAAAGTETYFYRIEQ